MIPSGATVLSVGTRGRGTARYRFIRGWSFLRHESEIRVASFFFFFITLVDWLERLRHGKGRRPDVFFKVIACKHMLSRFGV